MTELHHPYRKMAPELEEKDQTAATRAESFSFIVRVWKESSSTAADNPAGWRGSIEQVGQNQRFYIHQLDSILAFIEEQTGMRVERPHTISALRKGLRRWWNKMFAQSRDG
jgi:hypothetical protein